MADCNIVGVMIFGRISINKTYENLNLFLNNLNFIYRLIDTSVSILIDNVNYVDTYIILIFELLPNKVKSRKSRMNLSAGRPVGNVSLT